MEVTGRGPKPESVAAPRTAEVSTGRGFRETLAGLHFRPRRGPEGHPAPPCPRGEARPRASSPRQAAPSEPRRELRESCDAAAPIEERPAGVAEHEHDPARGALGGELDPLDAHARHVAQLAPPPSFVAVATQTAEAEPTARAARSLEELVPELVRRIAWAGDGKRGTVRLELGAGGYAGASVLVHADGRRVRVELGGLPEHALAPLRDRLSTRLLGRGFDLESVS